MVKVKKALGWAALLVMTVSGMALAVTAEERQILTAMTGILRSAANLAGYGTLGFGLLWGLWAYSSGDDDKWSTAFKALAGGLGMLLIVTVVNMFIRASGVGSAIR